jgi:hypothetical protein
MTLAQRAGLNHATRLPIRILVAFSVSAIPMPSPDCV